jgi:integrase
MARRNTGPKLRFLDKRGCWYITWTEGGRSRERSTATADREQAEIALAGFLHERTRATGGPRDPSETLITDVLDDYAREHGPTTKAPWRIACAIEALGRFWEGRAVGDVTRQTCARYATQRARSNGTTRRELGVLQAAINHAHQEGRLTRPISVSLPQSPEPRDRWLTVHEAAKLLRAAIREPRVRLHLPLFILIGLYTGRRKDAILDLRWPQVDLEMGRIDFRVPGASITNKRRGHIPLPPKLLVHLRRARARGTELGFVINENGARLKDIKRGFASACRKAGLDDVTPHTLRHTAATWLMQAGKERSKAADFLAMTEETLRRIYEHHHPAFLREEAAALNVRPRNVRGIGEQTGSFTTFDANSGRKSQ